MDDLIEAVIEVIKTRKARDEAVASCEYDAGYWCSDEGQDADRAKDRLESELQKIIDARVCLILEKTGTCLASELTRWR